jgi:hypothetical protein
MENKPRVIATWSDKDTFRVVSLFPNRREPRFIIEKLYKDSLGEESWREYVSSEEIGSPMLDLLKGLDIGRFELVKKY